MGAKNNRKINLNRLKNPPSRSGKRSELKRPRPRDCDVIPGPVAESEDKKVKPFQKRRDRSSSYEMNR